MFVGRELKMFGSLQEPSTASATVTKAQFVVADFVGFGKYAGKIYLHLVY